MFFAKKNQVNSDVNPVFEDTSSQIEDDELLPADHDSYAYILEDDRPIETEDDDSSPQITEEELAKAELLLGDGENNWTEQETDLDTPMEVSIEDPNDSWLGGENSSNELDTGWFLDEQDSENQSEIDDGAEGLLEHEEFNLALETPNEDWEEDESASESFEESIKRLGIDFPIHQNENSEPIVEVGPSTLLGWTFLGPIEGTITSVAFNRGAPVAIGSDLFGLGADGLLHTIPQSRVLGDSKPNSISALDNRLFIGTQIGGCFTSSNLEHEFEARNNWNATGLNTGSKEILKSVSTSFQVDAFRISKTVNLLLGLTGNGHLFQSIDNGHSWSGPLTPDRCIAFGHSIPNNDIIALTENSKGKRLLNTRNFESKNWTEIPLPKPIATGFKNTPVFISAHGSSILICTSGSKKCSFRSHDLGQTWNLVQSLQNTTVLVRDPTDPFFLVAASHMTNTGYSVLKISDDDGQNWKTAFVIGNAPDGDDDYGPIPEAKDLRFSPIISLAIDTDATRQILASTTTKTYLITLAKKRGIH